MKPEQRIRGDWHGQGRKIWIVELGDKSWTGRSIATYKKRLFKCYKEAHPDFSDEEIKKIIDWI